MGHKKITGQIRRAFFAPLQSLHQWPHFSDRSDDDSPSQILLFWIESNSFTSGQKILFLINLQAFQNPYVSIWIFSNNDLDLKYILLSSPWPIYSTSIWPWFLSVEGFFEYDWSPKILWYVLTLFLIPVIFGLYTYRERERERERERLT